LKRPPRRTTRQRQRDVVGPRCRIRLRHPCQEVTRSVTISSVDCEGVREVFVETYGLVRPSRHDRQLDGAA